MVLLPGDKVLAAAGYDPLQVWDPAKGGSWVSINSMSTSRFDFEMVSLQDGTALAAGGLQTPNWASNDELVTADLFYSSNQSRAPTGSMDTPRRSFQMVMLLANSTKVL